jgi:hypothetical protein
MNINSFTILGVSLLLGAGAYLYKYLINKVSNNIIYIDEPKKIDESARSVYIIRRLPSLNLDEKIKEYIKKIDSKSKYRILTTDTYQNSRVPAKQPLLNSLVYKRFLQKIFKKQDNIVIMNRNLFHWEYDNYYLLARSLNIPVKIIEFTTDKQIREDNINLYSQYCLEEKLFEKDPRTNLIVKL